MQHDLKCWPEFFEPLLSGKKTAELRYNDRRYQVGDVLRIREWEPNTESYSGRECWRLVTHVVHGAGHVGAIAPLKGLGINYVVLSLRKIDDVDAREQDGSPSMIAGKVVDMLVERLSFEFVTMRARQQLKSEFRVRALSPANLTMKSTLQVPGSHFLAAV